MANETVIPYRKGQCDEVQERSLKIALLLSVLAHALLGAGLFHWQLGQKPLPSPEIKIQLKLADNPVMLSQPVKPELTKVLPNTPIRQLMPINPVNPMSVAASPIARQGESAPAEKVEPSTAPAAQVNAADVIAKFVAHLEQRKEYPYIARKRGQTGTVTLQILIAPDGTLRNVAIVASSGVAILDNAAIALVRQSCPFRHETGTELRMAVPINYNLKD